MSQLLIRIHLRFVFFLSSLEDDIVASNSYPMYIYIYTLSLYTWHLDARKKTICYSHATQRLPVSQPPPPSPLLIDVRTSPNF